MKRFFAAAAVAVLLLLLPVTCFAAEERFCPAPKLAVLSSSPSCRASYRISEGRVLCIPTVLWSRVLSARAGACGEWAGEWKAYSSPRNAASDRPKAVQYRFIAWKYSPASAVPYRQIVRVLAGVDQLRTRVSSELEKADELGILRRLVLNERCDQGRIAFLRLLGFVHLAAASGIHLYSLAAVVLAFIYFVSSRAGIAPDRGRRFALPLTTVFCLGVWLLAGARPGMLRPGVVVTARWLAERWGIRWRAWAPLAIALLADGVVALSHALHGEEAWAPGRLHYALAVGGGLAAMEVLRGRSLIRLHLALAVGSWLATACVDVFALHLVSPLTPLFSFLTIPVISFPIYPAACLAGLCTWLGWTSLAGAFAQVAGSLMSVLISTTARLALATASLWVVSPGVLLLGAVVAALVIGVIRATKRRGCMYLGLLFCSILAVLLRPLSSEPRSPPADGEVVVADRVSQLDVGQGDSSLVQAAHGRSAGLIDAGSRFGLSAEAWIRVLAAHQLTGLDWIVLSHLDEDHAGGVETLSRLIDLPCLVRPGAVNRPCAPFPVFEVPAASARSRQGPMLVTAIPFGSGGLLLSAGDATRAQERALVPWARARIASARPGPLLFKVSHHGSRTSTDPELLDALRPDRVWISSGVGNRFGHPSAAVLGSFRDRSISVERTDVSGALSWPCR